MKLILLLLAASVLVLWVGLAPAQAEPSDFILSFEPPAQPDPPPPPDPPAPPAPPPISVAPEHRPLPIPAHGTRPPMRFHSPSQLPSGVNRQAVAVALNEGHLPAEVLPPVPPRLAPELALAPPPESAVAITEDATTEVAPPSADDSPQTDPVALRFELAPTVEPPAPVAQVMAEAPPQPPLVSTLFEGGSQSLVARTVGSAEGTRTATGEITSAYHGHTDPGNRAWNLGTFSYQHGAASAEEADRKQLTRLQSQTEVIKQRAFNQGMSLTLEETLNGIDLANQSPLAAIGRVGYIERLAEVKTWGLEGTEAIVVARTRSYINPNTGRRNAPGLGNTEASITRDQRRRTDAIARALDAYRQEYPTLNLTPTLVTLGPPEVLAALSEPLQPEIPQPEPDLVPLQISPRDLPTPTVAIDALTPPADQASASTVPASLSSAPTSSTAVSTPQGAVPQEAVSQGMASQEADSQEAVPQGAVSQEAEPAAHSEVTHPAVPDQPPDRLSQDSTHPSAAEP